MPKASADWKSAYRNAMCELNPANVPLLVATAETTMFLRYQQIADSSVHREERVQMANALNDLHALKAGNARLAAELD